MTVVCCICNKTKNKNGWTNQPPPEKNTLSHGYCPDCFAKVMQKINESFIGKSTHQHI